MAKTTTPAPDKEQTSTPKKKQTPPPDTIPYEAAAPGMKDQDWRNLVGLLQMRVKELETIVQAMNGGRTATQLDTLLDRVQAQSAKLIDLEKTDKEHATQLAALKAQTATIISLDKLEKIVKEHAAQLAALTSQDNSTKGA